MESFDLLFERCRFWVGRCPGLLVGLLLLLTQQGWGQIYAAAVSTGSFKYLDLATQTWTTKANSPVQLTGLAAYQGKIYGSAYATTNFYVYDPVANTWATKASIIPTGFINSRLVTAGAYIYAVSFDLGKFSRYNPATNTWTELSATGLPSLPAYMAFDGGDYIYCGTGNLILARYSISGNSWTWLATPPDYANAGVTFTNGKLYFLFGNSTKFYSFDPITSVYTQLANAPTGSGTLIAGESNYIYRGGYTDFQQYDISTNTWTTYTGPGFTFPAMAYLGGCSLEACVPYTVKKIRR